MGPGFRRGEVLKCKTLPDPMHRRAVFQWHGRHDFVIDETHPAVEGEAAYVVATNGGVDGGEADGSGALARCGEQGGADAALRAVKSGEGGDVANMRPQEGLRAERLEAEQGAIGGGHEAAMHARTDQISLTQLLGRERRFKRGGAAACDDRIQQFGQFGRIFGADGADVEGAGHHRPCADALAL